jgi:hypothetical protein
MRCIQTIEDINNGSYQWCCNVVLVPVGPLVSSHAYFGLQTTRVWHFAIANQSQIDGIDGYEIK